jgi:MYXO-CTERM domain-containing protein
MPDLRPGGWTLAFAIALAIALATGAGAQEVKSGLGTRLTPQGMEFAASLASGLSIEIPSLPLEFTVDELGCEYDLYLYGYSGEVELGEFYLEPVAGTPDHLSLTGSVTRFDVVDIIIEATSPDWWCPNYNEEDHDVIVSTLSTDGASFVLRADGEVMGDALVLEVLDSSSVHLGDVQISTTPWYLPDELMEASVESFGDEIEAFILAEAADLLAALLFELPTGGVLADFTYEARIAEVSVDADGLVTTLDAGAGYAGEIGTCGGGTIQLLDDVGDPGEISGTSGDVQLAVTEEFANALLAMAWSAGLLCQEFQHLDFADASPLFPALQDEHGVRFAYEVVDQPTVSVSAGEVHLDLPEVRLELEDTAEGEPLFRAVIAVSADVGLSVDEDRHVLALSLLWADLDFLHLDASGLLHGTNYTEESFLELIDSQVLLLLPDQLVDMPLVPLSFGITGLSADTVDGLTESIGVQLLDLELRDGVALAVLEGLLDVDDEPPWVEILTDLEGPRTATEVTIEYTGEDDRPGPLTYSWRVDGGAWSFWSAEARATFVVVGEGRHDFDVRARDAFWNVSSADSGSFRLDLGASGVGDDDEGCGCDATSEPSRAAVTALLGALLVGLLVGRRTTRA